jgi:glucose-1-phosphate adenylyltransferase
VRRSVLSPGVHVEGEAMVENAILLDGVRIGAGAVVRNAIVDKNVQVPPQTEIGVEPDRDLARFDVSAAGVVAIGKDDEITEPR